VKTSDLREKKGLNLTVNKVSEGYFEELRDETKNEDWKSKEK
jgi:hypothetical protein